MQIDIGCVKYEYAFALESFIENLNRKWINTTKVLKKLKVIQVQIFNVKYKHIEQVENWCNYVSTSPISLQNMYIRFRRGISESNTLNVEIIQYINGVYYILEFSVIRRASNLWLKRN